MVSNKPNFKVGLLSSYFYGLDDLLLNRNLLFNDLFYLDNLSHNLFDFHGLGFTTGRECRNACDARSTDTGATEYMST